MGVAGDGGRVEHDQVVAVDHLAEVGAPEPQARLAAQRAGINKVVLPKENEADLEDLPNETRKGIEFVLADHVDEVLATAFDGAAPLKAPRRVGSPERKAAAQA